MSQGDGLSHRLADNSPTNCALTDSPVPAQLGALFTLNGRVLGLDLFDSARTLSTLLPKLVESSALDAIDAGDAKAGEGARHVPAPSRLGSRNGSSSSRSPYLN